MAVDAAGLESDLEVIGSGGFGAIEDAADAWGVAMGSYAANVLPASTQVVTAAGVLQEALEEAFDNTDPVTTAAALEAAFGAFATLIGGGMAPAFTATPPSEDVGFEDLLAEQHTSHADAAEAWADAIDAWFTSGTAVPSGGGAAVPWS